MRMSFSGTLEIVTFNILKKVTEYLLNRYQDPRDRRPVLLVGLVLLLLLLLGVGAAAPLLLLLLLS